MAFLGTNTSGQQGIYTNSGGTLNVVANENTAIPGGAGNFNSFLSPTISNQNVAFVGSDSSNNQGIYTNTGGALTKVIDVTNPLSGKTLTSLDISKQGLSGNSVAFLANFTDGSSGIFSAALSSPIPASVPEPSSGLGLLAFGALGVGSVLKRHRK